MKFLEQAAGVVKQREPEGGQRHGQRHGQQRRLEGRGLREGLLRALAGRELNLRLCTLILRGSKEEGGGCAGWWAGWCAVGRVGRRRGQDSRGRLGAPTLAVALAVAAPHTRSSAPGRLQGLERAPRPHDREVSAPPRPPLPLLAPRPADDAAWPKVRSQRQVLLPP